MSLTNPTLVLNCGSSSIKYALISEDGSVRIEGLAEALGNADARIKHTHLDGTKEEFSLPNADHQIALQKVLSLIEQFHPVAVGHRVVHGGREFSQAVRIDDRRRNENKELCILAPLHNTTNATDIQAVRAWKP